MTSIVGEVRHSENVLAAVNGEELARIVVLGNVPVDIVTPNHYQTSALASHNVRIPRPLNVEVDIAGAKNVIAKEN